MLKVFLTGLAMGAADVVPGVSGGTVAFISGIYFRLLDAIRGAPMAALSVFKDGFPAAWRKLDGNFLVTLFAGIIISVLSLAQLITWLLATYPTIVWGFFFGLILASSVYLGRQVRWSIPAGLMLLLGIAAALTIGAMRPNEIEPTTLAIFGSGAIAICAMILPGISGSFILLLLGMYPTVLAALKNVDLLFIATFAGGCLVGLLGFSHLLAWLLARFRAPVLALLTGFLAGSLSVVWPWQNALETFEKSDGRTVALRTENVLPEAYATLSQQEPHTLWVIGMALLGIALVYALARFGPGDEVVE